jgi:secreted PhoX family phosphatase
MPNTKPVGVAFSDPELVAGTTITGATISGGTVSATDITTTGGLYIKSATVAATGSTQSDAASVSDGFTLVSAADATKGVKLPAAVAGRTVILKNNANAVLKVWPATGDGINAITVDSNYVLAAYTSSLLVAYDSTTWYSVPLLAS